MKAICKCGWAIYYQSRQIRMPCQNCWRTVDSNNCHQGLGDAVEFVTFHIGGRQFKRLYRKLFKRDCGCAKRKAWLNSLTKRRRNA